MTTTHVLRSEVKAGGKVRVILSQAADNALVFEISRRQVLAELDRMERGQLGPFLVKAYRSPLSGTSWIVEEGML
jgi:hypothetical protein